MTIVITQTCDSCGKSRELPPTMDHRISYMDGGWRNVKAEKHMCADCINKAVGK